jgi:hypothetical protein
MHHPEIQIYPQGLNKVYSKPSAGIPEYESSMPQINRKGVKSQGNKYRKRSKRLRGKMGMGVRQKPQFSTTYDKPTITGSQEGGVFSLPSAYYGPVREGKSAAKHTILATKHHKTWGFASK